MLPPLPHAMGKGVLVAASWLAAAATDLPRTLANVVIAFTVGRGALWSCFRRRSSSDSASRYSACFAALFVPHIDDVFLRKLRLPVLRAAVSRHGRIQDSRQQLPGETQATACSVLLWSCTWPAVWYGTAQRGPSSDRGSLPCCTVRLCPGMRPAVYRYEASSQSASARPRLARFSG